MMWLGVVLAAAAAQGHAQGPPGGPPPARILALGDSLTLGAQGQGGGYRTPLGEALKGDGAGAFDAGFVGGLYWHGDHSGYSGHTLSGILYAVRSAGTMELTAPTHVLLMGGTNDAYFYPPLGANATTMLERLDALLSFLLDRPSPPLVLVATPPPVLADRCAAYSQGPCAPSINANIKAFNDGVPAVIARARRPVTGPVNTTGRDVRLVNMSEAGFVPDDYWTAGIHFNDNGWCKMAKVWAKALMPTLPRRAVVHSSGAPPWAPGAAAGAAAFAEITVPTTPACIIPGATLAAAPPGPGGGAPGHAHAGPVAAGKGCDAVVTVNASSTDERPFSAFYGDVAAALGLPFGSEGSFCAWTSLAPRQFDLAPWASHGAADAAGIVASPSGPLFQMFQSLGSRFLHATVSPVPGTLRVPLALATVRQWSTQSTVSVRWNPAPPSPALSLH